MKGTFEARRADVLASREDWSIHRGPAGASLKARGSVSGKRGATWTLEALADPRGAVSSFELQLSLEPPPTEVTTVAMRSFGDRAFVTRIPPGGVPERIESALGPGSVVVGPSIALMGLCAAALDLKPGMGRRAVFLALGAEGLEARLEDGLVLYSKRSRGSGPGGAQGWLRRIEVKRAANVGVPDAVLHLDDRTGAVVRAELHSGPNPSVAQLTEFTG